MNNNFEDLKKELESLKNLTKNKEYYVKVSLKDLAELTVLILKILDEAGDKIE